MRSAAVVPVVFATSDMERSTSSPGPPWRTTRVAASAATAAYSPLTHSIVRPPACTGSRLGCPRTANAPLSACRMISVNGRSAYGPAKP